MMDAMDCGADDIETEEECFTIYTLPDDFNAVAEAMAQKNYTFVSAQIEMVPQNYQKLESEEHIKLMEKLIDIMEDDDDVQNVWHNWEQ
jgi:transcriptional/translational regulatory protein YebC/TACO1